MLSAKEARRMLYEKRDINQEEWLKRIESTIKKAICSGFTRVFTEEPVPKEVIDVLERLGYTVKITSQYNEVCTEISW